MFKKLATVIGYAKAPKTTYLLRHPVEGTKNFLAVKGLKSMITTRTAAIGAAVVAIPAGLLAWKATRNGDE